MGLFFVRKWLYAELESKVRELSMLLVDRESEISRLQASLLEAKSLKSSAEKSLRDCQQAVEDALADRSKFWSDLQTCHAKNASLAQETERVSAMNLRLKSNIEDAIASLTDLYDKTYIAGEDLIDKVSVAEYESEEE